jgi:hypothetical protein
MQVRKQQIGFTPAVSAMICHVLWVVWKQIQIFWSVIASLSVYVVDDLLFGQLAPDERFHNNAVKGDISFPSPLCNIGTAVRKPATPTIVFIPCFAKANATTTAKPSPSLLGAAGINIESFLTLLTLNNGTLFSTFNRAVFFPSFLMTRVNTKGLAAGFALDSNHKVGLSLISNTKSI